MVKKIKKPQEKPPQEKLKIQKHPLSQPAPKNFRHGNDIRPRIVKSRFVKFPRYVQLQRQKRILMKRLKCPPALAQFFDPLDKDQFKKIFKILEKYSPDSRNLKKFIKTEKIRQNLIMSRIKKCKNQLWNFINHTKAREEKLIKLKKIIFLYIYYYFEYIYYKGIFLYLIK